MAPALLRRLSKRRCGWKIRLIFSTVLGGGYARGVPGAGLAGADTPRRCAFFWDWAVHGLSASGTLRAEAVCAPCPAWSRPRFSGLAALVYHQSSGRYCSMGCLLCGCRYRCSCWQLSADKQDLLCGMRSTARYRRKRKHPNHRFRQSADRRACCTAGNI